MSVYVRMYSNLDVFSCWRHVPKPVYYKLQIFPNERERAEVGSFLPAPLWQSLLKETDNTTYAPAPGNMKTENINFKPHSAPDFERCPLV